MKPELLVRQMVHAMGFRYRLHVPQLPGKPDLVFASRKKIIEVRGCFWHQHPGCADAHVPKSHTDYWRPKLARNKRRDKQNAQILGGLGWSVLEIWECDLSDRNRLSARIRKFLKS